MKYLKIDKVKEAIQKRKNIIKILFNRINSLKLKSKVSLTFIKAYIRKDDDARTLKEHGDKGIKEKIGSRIKIERRDKVTSGSNKKGS